MILRTLNFELRTPRLMALFFLLGHLATWSPSHLAYAAVPHLIRYQGQVADQQGVPLEGPYSLTFRLYDAETAGAKVWEETQPSVPLQGGHFSVLLGQVTALNVDWAKPLWLGFQLGTDAELAPRQRITSVPLAITAERLANSEAISPVNLLKDGSFELWEGGYPVLNHWRTQTTGSVHGAVKKAADPVRYGQASAQLVYDKAGHYGNVFQDLPDVAPFRGRPVTLSVWAYATQPRQVYLDIEDTVTSSFSRAHSGNGTWEHLTLTHVVSPQATRVMVMIGEVSIAQLGVADESYPPVYLDGASLVEGPMPFAFSPNPQDPQDISARVYNSSAISLSNANPAALTFNSERWDADSIHSTDSNTSRLTAQTTGKYYLYGQATFSGQATGYRLLQIKLNGSTVLAETAVPAMSANLSLNVSTYYNLSATDYVELIAYQTSGGSLTVEAQPNFSPEFGMVKLP